MKSSDYVPAALRELDSWGLFSESPEAVHTAFELHTLPESWQVPKQAGWVATPYHGYAMFTPQDTRRHLESHGHLHPQVTVYIAPVLADGSGYFELFIQTQSGFLPGVPWQPIYHGVALVHLIDPADARIAATGKYREHVKRAVRSSAIREEARYW